MKKFFTVIAAVLFAGSMMAATTMTCAEAATAALSVENNNDLYNNGEEILVEGYVTAIQTAFNAQYSNVSFWLADEKGGTNTIQAYRAACGAAEDAPAVGDRVSVTGNLTKYNSTPEFAAGCTFVILEKDTYVPQNLGQKTIAEFLALKNTRDTCILRGAIANIKMDNNDATLYNKYGNFDLVDATGTVYIYGLLTPDGEAQQFREMGLNEGDSITVKAIYTEYNGDPQVKNAILMEDVAIETADVVFAMVDFVGQGVSGGGENSVVNVTKDGVTFSCTNGYGDGQYGVRCYKGSTVTITSAEQQIGKIVFEFGVVSGDKKNGGLDDEIVVNGMEWTVTLSEAQARMNKISIYFGEYEAIENVTLTEKAQKVMIDGAIYIIRDGKMFNLQGAQVR